MRVRRTRGRGHAQPGHRASPPRPRSPSEAALGDRVTGRGPWSRRRSGMSGQHPTLGTDEVFVKGWEASLESGPYTRIPRTRVTIHGQCIHPTDAVAHPVGLVRPLCGRGGRTGSRRWCWSMRPWRGRAWMRLLPPPAAERERLSHCVSHQEFQEAPPAPPVYGGHCSCGHHPVAVETSCANGLMARTGSKALRLVA